MGIGDFQERFVPLNEGRRGERILWLLLKGDLKGCGDDR